MSTLPLITHQRANSVIAWRDGCAVSAAQFLFDVAQLCEILPGGSHMLNACNDRYRFAVGLAAALLNKKISLLPPAQTPEMIRQLQFFAPDVFCLTDGKNCPIALPQLQFPALAVLPETHDQDLVAPEVDSGQTVAYLFTSGSTGTPGAHPKTWGALVRNAQSGARLCGLSDGRHHTVIGTVPPQHMFGFESTVLMVMQSANALATGEAFYPADICDAIACVPRPRMLVSTPVHLRSLMQAGLQVPALDLILSATAPLSLALAEQLEAACQTPVLEIYGSTETGRIAARNPTQTPQWQLLDGIRLSQQDGVAWASGAHIESATPLQDVIEKIDERRFLLHGRTADLVNIAGKRSSLTYLNLQLHAIPGVVDGCFFMPDQTAPDGVTRLTAFVVAPACTVAALMTALRARVDAVFLPRPLILVDALPRNATGKLPCEALKLLALARLQDSVTAGHVPLALAADHPVFAGHFPGTPIVPGALLLDLALQAIGQRIGTDLSACQINMVKFLSPVRPGEPLSVRYETPSNGMNSGVNSGAIRFDILSAQRTVATGSIRAVGAS
ncbi:MAG: AMP-binding protein [Glaciimonas sp.]|nr:AMP-binding protein [Glaciimonas sp.]